MYVLRLDGIDYDSWKGGRRFTLVDCFRESYGVRGATIVTDTGRVVLRNAGSLYVRANLRAARRGKR